jgi:hypothetical protein
VCFCAAALNRYTGPLHNMPQCMIFGTEEEQLEHSNGLMLSHSCVRGFVLHCQGRNDVDLSSRLQVCKLCSAPDSLHLCVSLSAV